MPDTPSTPLHWSAYEHEHIERHSDWFWALGVIAVCAALASILFGNFLFALIIVLAATVIGLIARTPPELHEFEISDRGIRIGDQLHRYDEVISFWVETETEEPLLLVDTVKFMYPNLILPLHGVDPTEVRTMLLQYAKEVPMKEPLSHKILEFFGF